MTNPGEIIFREVPVPEVKDDQVLVKIMNIGKYESLELFMEALSEGNTKAQKKWADYLDNLAILISNLRMAYDMDIILGGEVGGYLADHMLALGEKVMEYNGFDRDIRYLKNCTYRKEASAVGAAKHFFSEFIKNI